MRKKIILLILCFLNFSFMFSEKYIFEGKKYIDYIERYFQFNDGFFEYYIYDDDIMDYKKTAYPCEIQKEGAYLVANIKMDNGINKIYIFSADENHMIMYDLNNKNTILTTLLIGPRDESWIYPINNARASSYLSEILKGKIVEYKPKNLESIDLSLSWVEGVDGFGKGEVISFNNVGNGSRKIYIINGFFYPENPQLFYDNNRIKTLKINCYKNGILIKTEYRTLQDTGEMQLLEFSERYTSFDFIVEEVYKGKRFDDTAITGIFVDALDLYKN